MALLTQRSIAQGFNPKWIAKIIQAVLDADRASKYKVWEQSYYHYYQKRRETCLRDFYKWKHLKKNLKV